MKDSCASGKKDSCASGKKDSCASGKKDSCAFDYLQEDIAENKVESPNPSEPRKKETDTMVYSIIQEALADMGIATLKKKKPPPTGYFPRKYTRVSKATGHGKRSRSRNSSPAPRHQNFEKLKQSKKFFKA
jgi:hypothetical protein